MFFAGFAVGIIVALGLVILFSTMAACRRFIEILVDGKRMSIDVVKPRNAKILYPEAGELAERMSGYNKRGEDAALEDVL